MYLYCIQAYIVACCLHIAVDLRRLVIYKPVLLNRDRAKVQATAILH